MNLNNLSAYLWCINIGCLESPSNETTNSKHKHNSDSPEMIEAKKDSFRTQIETSTSKVVNENVTYKKLILKIIRREEQFL